MKVWTRRFRRRAGALTVTAVIAASLAGAVASPTQAAVFVQSNNEPITFAPGVPGSSKMLVTGSGGYITTFQVRLLGLSSSDAANLDIELVGPSGAAVPLMSDACSGAALSSVDLTFDDSAPGYAPTVGGCTSGSSYKPTSINPSGDSDTWLKTPTAQGLGALIATNPNGEWTLYVSDDSSASIGGQINVGFELTFETSHEQGLIPGAGTSGTANPYPIAISGKSGTVTDVNVNFRGVSHSAVADIDAIIVSPANTAVWLTSDACGSAVAVNLVNWTFDDETANTLGTPSTCGSGTYKPSAFSDADSDTMPAPAPAGPYGSSLSAFDGQSATGVWRIFIIDDHDGSGGGFLLGAGLDVATAPTTTTPATPGTPTTSAVPPDTRFVMRTHRSHSRTAVLAFSSTKSPSTFQCRLDRAKWTSCAQRVRLKNLSYGRHFFRVRAVDAAGNVDKSPARNAWRVLRPGQK